MTDNAFFKRYETLTASAAAELCGGLLVDAKFADREILTLASLGNAQANSLVFAEGSGKDVSITALGKCTLICTENLAQHAHGDLAVIVVKKPQHAFAVIGRFLFPQSVRPAGFATVGHISSNAFISPTSKIEPDVVVEAGAVIGADVEIGSGSVIGAGAVLGNGVKIGRNCTVGPNASIQYAFIGNQVIIHAGACIGQDGFGFVPGPGGLEKMPQLGRVIIQDLVEVGANTTIDRGAIDDTIIGEGTKIDNLVQIAHNCHIGRYCVITAHCGISGSVKMGDGVMLGGRVGIADHVTLGDGVQVAATSGVMNDIPAGQRWAGAPAQPIKEFFREVAFVRGLVREKKMGQGND